MKPIARALQDMGTFVRCAQLELIAHDPLPYNSIFPAQWTGREQTPSGVFDGENAPSGAAGMGSLFYVHRTMRLFQLPRLLVRDGTTASVSRRIISEGFDITLRQFERVVNTPSLFGERAKCWYVYAFVKTGRIIQRPRENGFPELISIWFSQSKSDQFVQVREIKESIIVKDTYLVTGNLASFLDSNE